MSEENLSKLDEQIKTELSRLEAKNKKDPEESIAQKNHEVIVPERSELEEKALKMGWRPDGPKDAKRFIEDKSFFDRIEAKNKKIDELTDIVKNLVDHNTKIEKASYEKALRDLQAAKEEAVSQADMNRYKAIEREQGQVYKELKEVDSYAESVKPKDEPKQSEPVDPILLAWKEEQKDWFNLDTPENKLMVQDADYIDRRIAQQLAMEGRTVSKEEHLKLVMDKMRQEWPHRFKNPKRDEPSDVDVSGSSRDSGKTDLSSKLTKQQKYMYEKAKMYGSKLSMEDYAKQLKLTGDLK